MEATQDRRREAILKEEVTFKVLVNNYKQCTLFRTPDPPLNDHERVAKEKAYQSALQNHNRAADATREQDEAYIQLLNDTISREREERLQDKQRRLLQAIQYVFEDQSARNERSENSDEPIAAGNDTQSIPAESSDSEVESDS
ncbi:hypothetical protein V7S43_015424 [Phytophthora oleae]|uniref:Uncharacterized protein n=1 Tax=Phytophthora oleae TaxID=2107226 RepID=A0ABD3EZP5_9STRA